MKVLLINKFFYLRGGSERMFFETAKLLKEKGHDVSFFSMQHPQNEESPYGKYFVSNIDYETRSFLHKIKAASNLLYSFEAKSKLKELIRYSRPDIVHLNNISHQISPSILHVLNRENIPVVMTMHDAKLVCASYLLMAKGKPCQACEGGRFYECFLKKCVKDSRMKSLLNTLEMYLHHKILHIYDIIDTFIAPSVFLKSKIEEMGFKGRIIHLSNFLDLGQFTPDYGRKEDSIIYFGRLSREKGLVTLLDAMKSVKDITLKIVGEGPQRLELEEKINREGMTNIRLLGYKTGDDLKKEISSSMAVILPSECQEILGLTVLEGFALGKPGLGSRIGGIPELVKDGITGFTFEPGNAADMSVKIKHLTSDHKLIEGMGRAARAFAEEKFTKEIYYEGLIDIYKDAIARSANK